MPGEYDAVFFDSGGTLFDAARSRKEAEAIAERRPEVLRGVLAAFGYQCEGGALERQIALSAQAVSASLGARYSFFELLKDVCAKMGLGVSQEVLALATTAYAGPRYNEWLFPGVTDMLISLKKAGFYVGLIANTAWPGFAMRTAYAGVGIEQYFDGMTISCDEGVDKPDKGIFETAAMRAGLDKKSKVIHVGDSIECDIEGARAMGWDTAYRINGDEGSGGLADVDFRERAKGICGEGLTNV